MGCGCGRMPPPCCCPMPVALLHLWRPALCCRRPLPSLAQPCFTGRSMQLIPPYACAWLAPGAGPWLHPVLRHAALPAPPCPLLSPTDSNASRALHPALVVINDGTTRAPGPHCCSIFNLHGTVSLCCFQSQHACGPGPASVTPVSQSVSPYRHTQPGRGLPVVNRLSALVSLATSMVQVESPVMGRLHLVSRILHCSLNAPVWPAAHGQRSTQHCNALSSSQVC